MRRLKHYFLQDVNDNKPILTMKTIEFEMEENVQGYIPEILFGAAFVTDLDSDLQFSSFDIKIM